jgi:hypothetical protein
MRLRNPAPVTKPVSSAVTHFGERVLPGKYGLRMSRETYLPTSDSCSIRSRDEPVTPRDRERYGWVFADENHTRYSEEYLALLRERALTNLDLNLAFFQQISSEDFESAIDAMLERARGLKSITDLRALDDVEGLYVMVLDDFKQAYIGQSWNIRQRIRSHWAGTKALDRLVFGEVHESVLSVDVFRPLDTTRIFAAKTVNADRLETRAVKEFPAEFLLNRVNGGLPTGLRAMILRAEMKKRQLSIE